MSLDLTINNSIVGFDYNGTTEFCIGGLSSIANVTTTSGGIFTSTNGGIVIDALTGEIDLDNSIPGNYQITYTPPVSINNFDPIGSQFVGQNAGDNFGEAVAMNALGNIVAIGIPKSDAAGTMSGMVKVFQLNGNTWSQMGTDIIGNTEQKLGFSIALNSTGKRLVIGSPNFGDDTPSGVNGNVKVFEWSGSSWSQMGSEIGGIGNGDEFGYAVDINSNGTIIVIGERGAEQNNSYSGRAYVYEFNGTDWNQLGSNITDGAGYLHAFGRAVAINDSGNRIFISTETENQNGNNVRSVYPYEFNGVNWVQLGNVVYGNLSGSIGHSLSTNSSGTRFATSSPDNVSLNYQTRIFEYVGNNWQQLGSDILTINKAESVDMNSIGNRVILGLNSNTSGNQNGGFVKVFEYDGIDWLEQANEIEGLNNGDSLGHSVAANAHGNQFIVGIPGFDQNGTSSGAVQVYTSNTVACTLPLDIYTPCSNHRLRADTTLICAGASHTIDAGTGFDSYLWSDGSTAQTLSATIAGTYTVTGTDANGCIASDSMVIDVLLVDITQNDTIICEGNSLVLFSNSSQTYSSGSNNSQLSGTLNNGLVGYWPLNGNANDESGNGNDGIVNGATPINDRFGNASGSFLFENDNYITIPPISLYDIQDNSPFTISVWINPSNFNSGGNIILKNGQYGLKYNGSSNIINYYDNKIPYHSSINNNWNINQWYQLTLVHTGLKISLYVDGVLDSEDFNNYNNNLIGDSIL